MAEPKIAQYGSWKSPITSELITTETIGLRQKALDGGDVYWVEMRPTEGGRNVIMRYSADKGLVDITPSPYNARTRVHEYGGGAFAVSGGTVFFSNFDDQRLYRQEKGAEPRPITPEAALRYADGVIDLSRNRIICVREDHTSPDSEAVNSLVSIDPDGGERSSVLVSGNDFYSSPCVSPDGNSLAWLTWNHPNMSWDGTELWVGEVLKDGSIGRSERIAGGEDVSIFEPAWSPDGVLYFVSDQTGWWNIYRRHENTTEPVVRMEAEFGFPQWVFGLSTYAFESANRLYCTYTQQGIWHLAGIDTDTGEFKAIETPYTWIGGLTAEPGNIVFTAGSSTEPTSIVRLDPVTKKLEVLRRSSEITIDPGYLSMPMAIEFPTGQGLTAHAFFYAPVNRDFTPPPGELPPLLVLSHGGPTGSTSGTLNLSIQYWTSRGFAVIDVNYGGSTGYGREYRERLKGQWGIVDVDDCVNGARYLVERGEADVGRLAIRGGSAGGYTTLCALTFRDTFKTGASYYGVSDLEALAKETHKFESRYLDSLIGPYPERRDLYLERSPITYTDWLSCPMILFQGLDDKVVPPNQAEMIVEALRAKKIPVAYLAFKGEQHGFRNAENIKRALDAELYFYSRVFGFEPADLIEPVKIENIEELRN
ncbi:prolyl oligopeptidase family serine peptidase [Candidatus Latescibacterota bacterium]